MGRVLSIFVIVGLFFWLLSEAITISWDLKLYALERDGHYTVFDMGGSAVLTSHAEFDTPNDAKEAAFSRDSQKFSVVYHYSHAGNYSWFGVWSTQTGEFLYSVRKRGWTTNFRDVFNR